MGYQFANFIHVSTVVVMPSSQNLQHGVLQTYLQVHWNTTVVVCSGLIGFSSLQSRKSVRPLAFPSHNQQSLQPSPLFRHHLNLCQVHYFLYLNSSINVFTVSLQFFIVEILCPFDKRERQEQIINKYINNLLINISGYT